MSKATAAVAPPLVPVESPVAGVNLALATLLVEAIKRRRKQLSSLTKHDQDDTSLQNIGNKAIDATTVFLNELRNQTESSRRRKDNKSSANAPINSIKFLLDILSNDTNSLHLRRSSLALIREISLRSSDARAYVADGDTLLQFVSIVESVGDVGDDCVSDGRGGINETRLSPAALFQQESIEFMQQLAFRYGQLYPKFTVASRLLGDRVSSQLHVQIDSQNIGTGTNEDGRRNSQRQNIHLIRRKRDEALECGPKACQSVERLICRAENCFKVLIPRWGGFNTVDNSDANEQLEGKIRSDNSLANTSPGNHISDDASVDLEDYDSIEWEEGDDGLLPDEESIGDSSHVGAVAQTLAVMERSGTLLDGKLSVQVGKPVANGSSETEAMAVDTQEGDAKADARLELEAIVKKISSKRIKRLSQWIHALTYADGLMERAVADPASGNVRSVVLLPKEARETKSLLLPQMMKLKAELDSILKSADVLGVSHSESDEGREREDNVQGTAATQSNVGVSNRGTSDRKRPWLSGTFAQGNKTAKKQKQSKNSKVRVIYRRK